MTKRYTNPHLLYFTIMRSQADKDEVYLKNTKAVLLSADIFRVVTTSLDKETKKRFRYNGVMNSHIVCTTDMTMDNITVWISLSLCSAM